MACLGILGLAMPVMKGHFQHTAPQANQPHPTEEGQVQFLLLQESKGIWMWLAWGMPFLGHIYQVLSSAAGYLKTSSMLHGKHVYTGWCPYCCCLAIAIHALLHSDSLWLWVDSYIAVSSETALTECIIPSWAIPSNTSCSWAISMVVCHYANRTQVLVPCSGLAQTWSFRLFGEWMSRWKVSLSFFLSVALSFKFFLKKYL